MAAITLPDLPFEIDIAVNHAPWETAVTNLKDLAIKAVEQILKLIENPKLGELSLAFIDDTNIQKLNLNYRHKDKPTNVLSFPDYGPAPLLGDIVLAFEVVEREANEKLIPIENHITHLIVHGFLHLQGYDHKTELEAIQMEALEIMALRALNIDNPYEIHD